MVGAVGEVAYEATKVVEDWGGWAVSLRQCRPNSARSLVIARRTECNPHCSVVFFVLLATPETILLSNKSFMMIKTNPLRRGDNH